MWRIKILFIGDPTPYFAINNGRHTYCIRHEDLADHFNVKDTLNIVMEIMSCYEKQILSITILE